MAGLFSILFGKKKKYPKGSLVFKVNGTAKSYNITYTTETGEIKQQGQVTSGFVYHYQAKPGDYYYFSVQSNSPKSETNLKVCLDSKLLKEDQANGDYKIATVSGIL